MFLFFSDEDPKLCEDLGVVKLIATKNSKGEASGTVHVKFRGNWGTVCDDRFDDNHAKVLNKSYFENVFTIE